MAEVIATSASLRLFGADLDPEEISRQLACIPTTSERKGDLMGPKRNITARQGGWKLWIEQENGNQLDRQIGELLHRTRSDIEVWHDLTRRFTVDIQCGVWLDEAGQGFGLQPATLAELGQRRIRIEFDVYYSGSDPDK